MNIYHEGDITKEALLFFNPMGTDTNFWRKNFPIELYKKYDVIFFDYSGFNSEFLKQTTIFETAQWVKNTILSGIDKPMHFCGYSYGGMVIQELIKEEFKNLKSIILIATQNRLTYYDKELPRTLKDVIHLDLLLYCRMLTLFSHAPSVLNANPIFPLQMLFNLNSSTASPAPIIQQLEQICMIDRIVLSPRLIPTLYMYGEHDRMIKADTAIEFNKIFENLNVIKFSDSYHMIDQDLINCEIINFLNKIHNQDE